MGYRQINIKERRQEFDFSSSVFEGQHMVDQSTMQVRVRQGEIDHKKIQKQLLQMARALRLSILCFAQGEIVFVNYENNKAAPEIKVVKMFPQKIARKTR